MSSLVDLHPNEQTNATYHSVDYSVVLDNFSKSLSSISNYENCSTNSSVNTPSLHHDFMTYSRQSHNTHSNL